MQKRAISSEKYLILKFSFPKTGLTSHTNFSFGRFQTVAIILLKNVIFFNYCIGILIVQKIPIF